MTTILIIGAGDMGERVADGLAAGGPGRRLLVAGRSAGGDAVAATVASARDCRVEAVRLDASRPDDVAALVAAACPDLIVNCASLRGPGRRPAVPTRPPGRSPRPGWRCACPTNSRSSSRSCGASGPPATPARWPTCRSPTSPARCWPGSASPPPSASGTRA
ncbi:saccharopine dehydrogenase NADP-binding domain-containing protein [Kitasatospora sp. NBC_01560]|uniref:saccharopine dehydrogenase NADP-binding domain-containing protein n=1 Tax=Kitasatospora sp. NBC_01560 TaxID=2975965 RepID=UPI0038692DB2